MNRTLPEMLHSLNTPANLSGGTDLTVLDRQQARMKWQQQQQPGFFNGNEQLGGFSQDFSGLISTDMGMGMGELVNPMVKPDPGVETGWADPGYRHYGYGNAGFEMGNAISRTISCPPAVAATAVAPVAAAVADEKLVSGVGRESIKKRKADKNQNLKVVAEEDTKEKRSKGSGQDGEIKEKNSSAKKNVTANTNNKETSNDTSKENSKVTEVQKPDYIHVRARRGQATDSHSLAERVRREKISERMKYLQDLVPGCNKITGKAGMLDEIINYVQSLQRQVEFLSMKLAAVNPRLDFSIDNFFTKEIFPASTSSFPAIGVSPEMVNPSFFEINQLQQLVSCGLEMGISPSDMAIRRTTSAPISIPETFLDSSCFNQIQLPSTWDAELQNLYGVEFQHARSSFLSQQFTGPMEGDNSKTGM